jgi:aromatic-amino-acid transaminase
LLRPSSNLVPASQERPGDDPIFALHSAAMARRARGEDVLNATLGALHADDGVLAVMPSVHETLRGLPAHQVAAYAPIRGPKAYLDAVLDDLVADSPLRATAVAAATPGGTGALYAALVNFLEPGQAVLTSSYYWAPYDTLADHAGRRVVTYPMFGADGTFEVGALERAGERLLRDQGRLLLILNSPCHNPTGYSLDAAEYEQLGAALERLAQRGPVTLLLDLAYEKFAGPDTASWRPLAERLAGAVQVCVAWTASKAFSLYGARVGAIVAFEPRAEARRRIENAFGYTCRGTWSNCNHAGQLAVAQVLTRPELHQRSLIEREQLRGLLLERVAAFNLHAERAGLSYPRYESGFFVSVFTDDPARTLELAQAEGVFVVPLPGAVRVALCATPAAQVPRLVGALARAMAGARR